jgi:hypothetical protein
MLIRYDNFTSIRSLDTSLTRYQLKFDISFDILIQETSFVYQNEQLATHHTQSSRALWLASTHVPNCFDFNLLLDVI